MGSGCAVLLADKAPSIVRVNGCEWEGLLSLAVSEARQVYVVAACRAPDTTCGSRLSFRGRYTLSMTSFPGNGKGIYLAIS